MDTSPPGDLSEVRLTLLFVEWWWERGGEPVPVLAALRGDPVSTLTALRAASRYGEAVAVERGGLPLADLAGSRQVARWRRVGDVHWVAIRELPDGGFAVEASWLRFCGADVYWGDTPAEALDAAMGRARALMDGLGGRWEVTVDGRAQVPAGAVVRPEGETDRVAGDPSRLVSQGTSVDGAGELQERTPAVR